MNRGSEINGILIVDKPAGITSHDVVDRVRRLFRTKRVGHTGTLDPDATGVLVLCLGNATRFAEYLSASAKHYVAEFVFGIRTDTMDASGQVLAEQDASALSEARLRTIVPAFRGKIQQIPPMVSARHHEGRRLYELAREGITVEREAREVLISELELVGFYPGARATGIFEVTCSTGTYIRALAEVMGAAAGTGAHMKALRRTWVGARPETAFTLAEAHTLPSLELAAGVPGTAGVPLAVSAGHRNTGGSSAPAGVPPALAAAVIPLSAALRELPQYRLQDDALRRLRHGQTVAASEVADAVANKALGAGPAAVLDEQGEVCAMVQREGGTLRPTKVLAP